MKVLLKLRRLNLSCNLLCSPRLKWKRTGRVLKCPMPLNVLISDDRLHCRIRVVYQKLIDCLERNLVLILIVIGLQAKNRLLGCGCCGSAFGGIPFALFIGSLGSLTSALLICTSCWLLCLLRCTSCHERFISQCLLIPCSLAYGPLERHSAHHCRILRLKDKLLVRLVLLNRQYCCILRPHDSFIILEHACIVSTGANINCHIINILRIILCLIFSITTRIKYELLITRFQLYITVSIIGPASCYGIFSRLLLSLHILLYLL